MAAAAFVLEETNPPEVPAGLAGKCLMEPVPDDVATTPAGEAATTPAGEDVAVPPGVTMETPQTSIMETPQTSIMENSTEISDPLAATVYAIGGVDCTNGVAYLSSAERFLVMDDQWKPLLDMTEEPLPPNEDGIIFPPPTLPRCEFAAAATPAGIYVLGGRCQNEYVSTAQVYDIASDTWTPLPPMRYKRRGLAAVSFGSKVFAIGGRSDSNNYLSSIECYDSEALEFAYLPIHIDGKEVLDQLASGDWRVTNEWLKSPDSNLKYRYSKRLDDDKRAPWEPSGAQWSSRIKAVNEGDGWVRVPLEAPPWMPVTRMESKRTAHCAAVLDSSLYVMGGHDGTTSFASAERYDFEVGDWFALPPMEKPRIHAAAASSPASSTLQKRSVFVFGGSSLLSVEWLEMTSTKAGNLKGEWITLDPMQSVRCRHAAVAVSQTSSIYILGGYDGTSYLSTMERFNVKTRRFMPTELPSMSMRRCDFGCTALG